MADSLTKLRSPLFHTALDLVLEEPDPQAAALELNQAAVDAGAAPSLFPGEPQQVIHDLMEGDQMMDYLTERLVIRGIPLPDLAALNQVESLPGLRTLLSI